MSCIDCGKKIIPNGCADGTRYVQPIKSQVPNTKSDCGTCGGLNTLWTLENGFRTRLRSRIAKNTLPTFDQAGEPLLKVTVKELPQSPRGMITFTGGNNPEYFEYQYKQDITFTTVNEVKVPSYKNQPGTAGDIYILKRGIHPYAQNFINDGRGADTMSVIVNGELTEISPDYNNCQYMSEHNEGEEVRRDTYAQEQSIFLQYTCCTPASPSKLGISALSIPADNPNFPIVVGINDFANCNKDIGIVRGLTKCVPVGEEVVVSFNDYATAIRAGLAKLTPNKVYDCATGSFTDLPDTGDNPDIAVRWNDYGKPFHAGIVATSRCEPNHTVLSKNDNATKENNGAVVLKPKVQEWNCSSNPDDPTPNGDINVASAVVQEGDEASLNNLALTYLSEPTACAKTNNFPGANCPLAQHKWDLASENNNGSAWSSVAPCNPCHPVFTGDNDPRLFHQRTKIYANEFNLFSDPFTLSNGSSYTPKDANSGYNLWLTNIDPIGTQLSCETKNSTYYGIKGPSYDLDQGKIIVVQQGAFDIKANIRIGIHKDDFTDSYHFLRARLTVNGVNTIIAGDFEEFNFDSCKPGEYQLRQINLTAHTGVLNVGDEISWAVDFDPLAIYPLMAFWEGAGFLSAVHVSHT